MKKFYLYKHIDTNGIPFYIGKGTVNQNFTFKSKRYARARSSAYRNNEWREIAKNGYTIEIIGEFNDLREVLSKENELSLDCVSCVNKQLNKFPEDKYIINKIDKNVANIKITDVDYYIYSSGIITNSDGKILTPHDSGLGYLQISLGKIRNKVNIYIHRAVALAFVPNIENKKFVNHKDFNRGNNKFSNLEWATPLENSFHAISFNRRKRKKVLQYDMEDNFIKEWESAAEYANFYHLNKDYVQMACSETYLKIKTCNGFKLKYKKE